MAVYTDVSDEDIAGFVAEYDIGEVVSFKGIAEGVENTNFLLQTTEAPFILTLYEKRVNPDDLPFYLGLMEHLSAKGLDCPVPIHGKDGVALRNLCGRPAAIISFLRGHVAAPHSAPSLRRSRDGIGRASHCRPGFRHASAQRVKRRGLAVAV